MKTRYEVLLGGEVEDVGFSKFDMRKDQEDVFEKMSETAKNLALNEVTSKLGDVKVYLGRDDYPFIEIQDRPFHFSPWSLTQLSEKMSMGAAGYVKKCIMNGFNDLVPLNFNRWIERNKDKSLVFRYHDATDRLRAVVSESYGFFDHIDVFNSLFDVYKDGGLNDFKLESGSITPDNLHLRIVSPEKVILPGVGNNDGSSIGMSIRNGQTGQLCASADFMVYTFICSNGLFVGSDFSQVFHKKHFNIDHEEFKKGFSKSIEKFPDYIAATINTLEEARSTSVIDDEEVLGEMVRRTVGLDREGLETLMHIFETDWDRSLWGLAGAVTQYAQLVGNAAKQYQLEQKAGNIIESGLRLAA